jgi:hypothetical protein
MFIGVTHHLRFLPFSIACHEDMVAAVGTRDVKIFFLRPDPKKGESSFPTKKFCFDRSTLQKGALPHTAAKEEVLNNLLVFSSSAQQPQICPSAGHAGNVITFQPTAEFQVGALRTGSNMNNGVRFGRCGTEVCGHTSLDLPLPRCFVRLQSALTACVSWPFFDTTLSRGYDVILMSL